MELSSRALEKGLSPFWSCDVTNSCQNAVLQSFMRRNTKPAQHFHYAVHYRGWLTDQQVWFPVDFQKFLGDILMKIQ